MDGMEYIPRLAESSLRHHLSRGKSVLLLGPRQTGKTTLLDHLGFDISISFVLPSVRLRYEKDPSLLQGEIGAIAGKSKKNPLVVLDEVQKVPSIMDVVQDSIDKKMAQFILTGSSARKLKKNNALNLLPGRIVAMRLDPFLYRETHYDAVQKHILYGSLPGIFQVEKPEDKETDLKSYVETYLEEEIRAEAVVRRVGQFARFLEYAGLESGNIVSFRALSQELGISHTTISSYFEILEDCLIAERIDPITKSNTRKKLTKSSKYVLFDLGVRRLCANEGLQLTPERWGHLFEQYVGLELIRNARLTGQHKIKFWRDPDGPEVDWVIEKHHSYTPIEAKWTEAPNPGHTRHLQTFLKEYPEAKKGYVVCRTERPVQLASNIMAISWKNIGDLFS